jgi:hypothetical protein
MTDMPQHKPFTVKYKNSYGEIFYDVIFANDADQAVDIALDNYFCSDDVQSNDYVIWLEVFENVSIRKNEETWE